jgi:hypothetical protein
VNTLPTNQVEQVPDSENRRRNKSVCAWIVIFAVCASGAAAEDRPGLDRRASSGAITAGELLSPALLEAARARIGEVSIVNENVFDNSDPAENRALHRWANALHIKTKPGVVRTQLLFQPGDTYDAQEIEETARLLRSNRYLSEATITPLKLQDGVVDLEVRTTDVWTLNPGISFGRGGGKNSAGIALKEYNLLGTGIGLGLGYKSNVDRDSLTLQYFDRNLFSSRYQLTAAYTNASDGYTQHFGLEKPFFALDTRSAIGGNFRSSRRTESLYDEGRISEQFELTTEDHDFYVGWSGGLKNGWSKRLLTGVGIDSSEYHPVGDGLDPTPEFPDDHRFVYPFFGIELLQDDFVTTKNFDQMHRTEDRHLGTRASFRIGYADPSFGSSRRAWIYDSEFSNTLLRNEKSTLVLLAGLSGRIESGSPANSIASLSARFDKRQSDKRLLHVSTSVTSGRNLDLENTVYLGGDSGLRGYPLRYQAGDSSALLTIEQRFFTDWYPFRLFNIGAAVFFDAGRTWGEDPAQGKNYGWLRDVGFGLRIGSARSGLGRMMHVDLAYPLDGGADISNVQLLVEARQGF